MTSPRPTMRWFGHPAIVLALVGLLFLDLLSIPANNARHSTVQRLILGSSRSAAVHGRPLPGSALRTEEGLEWVWPWDERYGHLDAYGEPLHASVFRDLVRRDGLYHLTRQRERLSIYDHNSLTQEELAALPGLVLRAIDASNDAQVVFARERRLLTAGAAVGGDFVIETRLSRGYVRNAISLVVLGLLLAAFLLGRTWLWVPGLSLTEVRQRQRIRRGQCLCCGYDLRGIPASIECPECGERRV